MGEGGVILLVFKKSLRVHVDLISYHVNPKQGVVLFKPFINDLAVYLFKIIMGHVKVNQSLIFFKHLLELYSNVNPRKSQELSVIHILFCKLLRWGICIVSIVLEGDSVNHLWAKRVEGHVQYLQAVIYLDCFGYKLGSFRFYLVPSEEKDIKFIVVPQHLSHCFSPFV